MKTYNLESLNKLRNYSRSFNTNTNFVNKTWQIFDDENNKIFIYFQADGTFVFAQNDQKAGGTWKFDIGTSILSLTMGESQIDCKPFYCDSMITALVVDENGNKLILVDTGNNSNFAPSTQDQLNAYCDYVYENADPIRKNAAQNNAMRKAEEMKARVEEIADQCDTYPLKKYSIISLAALLLVVIAGIYFLGWGKPYHKELGIGLLISPVVLGGILWGFFDTQRWQTAVKNMFMHFSENDESEIVQQMRADKDFKAWFMKNYDFDPTRIKKKTSLYD